MPLDFEKITIQAVAKAFHSKRRSDNKNNVAAIAGHLAGFTKMIRYSSRYSIS